MKLYSVFDNDQWVADMTADNIAERSDAPESRLSVQLQMHR